MSIGLAALCKMLGHKVQVFLLMIAHFILNLISLILTLNKQRNQQSGRM